MLIVGISGPSCSGKSTLARLILECSPNSHILPADDFYIRDIPLDPATGYQNWDTPDAIDYEKMAKTIEYILEHKEMPKDFRSSEIIEPSSEMPPEICMEAAKTKLKNTELLLIDGFLLFQKDSPITKLCDVKLLITADFKLLKERRSLRVYDTGDGYWEDPPEYFEKIVWPEFKRNTDYLFEKDQATGLTMAEKQNIFCLEADQCTKGDLLDWAVEIISSAP